MNKFCTKFRWLTVVFVFIVIANHGAAQSFDSIVPGTRIQVFLSDSLRAMPFSRPLQGINGSFVRATTDSIWLQPIDASSIAVSRAAVRATFVSRGASRSRSAVAFGFAVAIPVALIQVAYDRERSTRDKFAITGLSLGLGAVLGAISPYEQWRRLRQ